MVETDGPNSMDRRLSANPDSQLTKQTEQSRAEQSRAEQRRAVTFLMAERKLAAAAESGERNSCVANLGQ
jgi:hypothetical protein